MPMASKTEPTRGTKPKTTTKPKADASSKTTSAKTDKVQAEAADAKTTNDDATKGAEDQAHVSDATPDTEVAARSADVDEVKTETHRKEFVHGPGDYTKGSGFSHEANIAAVRQGLINAGLRPIGDVEHVSTKTHEDGISKVLAYEVEAIPAHDAVVSDADVDDPDDVVVKYEVAHPHVIQSDDGKAPATTAGE